MELFKHIVGVLAGIAVYVVVFVVSYVVIQFAGNIPIIGNLLYYPSDAAWSLLVIPAPAAAFSGAAVASAISHTAKPISAIIAIFWILNIIAMFLYTGFSWADLIQSIFAIGAACVCFSESSDK